VLIPGHPPDIVRQDTVSIKVGETVLVTGIVLGAGPFYRYDDIGFKVTTRSRTGDLIKASAMHKGGQWRNAKLDTIIADLIKPFGLKLRVEGDVGTPIKEFKIEHGESVLDAAARAAKKRGMLVRDNAAGEVVLCRAGQTKASGAIVRGQNVIELDDIGTDEERASEYIAYGQSEVADDFESSKQKKARTVDKEMRRYLPVIINADSKVDTADLQKLTDHQMRVRRGHAYGLQYRIEGWTTLGKAWDVNELIPIYDEVAGLDGEEWLIADIKYKVELKDGDVRIVTVRPAEAYEPEPEIERSKSNKKGGKASSGKAAGKDGAPLTKSIK
jgi:prophage tail gpP-like protein